MAKIETNSSFGFKKKIQLYKCCFKKTHPNKKMQKDLKQQTKKCIEHKHKESGGRGMNFKINQDKHI